jgi:lipopolysaccharide/colanic/teichoic acid biosynthesis glycosyltransferase
VAREASNIPAWKRILDVTLVILASPVWLPLMILLMLAVRLSSPGPIFYRQARVGYLGRTFMIYKFRSMKVDAETHVHEAYFERLMKESVPMVKLDGAGDPRILPWGRLMRATGLDELPQIFNVIRGEMSLVGPRPCTIPEFARYARWQKERVNAPPGLTGYWQVNGKNRTTFNEMIEMDIYYSKKMSVGLDLKIMLQTLPALLDQTIDSLVTSRRSTGGSFSSRTDSRESI